MNREPKHRAPSEDHPQHVSDALIADLKRFAPSPEAAVRIDQVYDRHGDPFAMYLALHDDDRYTEHVETNFRQRHLGRYEDREAPITGAIELFGRQADLDQQLSG